MAVSIFGTGPGPDQESRACEWVITAVCECLTEHLFDIHLMSLSHLPVSVYNGEEGASITPWRREILDLDAGVTFHGASAPQQQRFSRRQIIGNARHNHIWDLQNKGYKHLKKLSML